MSTLFSDLLVQVDDLTTSYNVSNIDLGNKKRAANRAIEFVQRRLMLPSDKKIHSFYFYEDIKYYDCPVGWNELLALDYNTSSLLDINNNVPNNRWGLYKDIDILRQTGVFQTKNKVAFTTLNAKNQLLLTGHNNRGVQMINGFDSIVGVQSSTDISSISIDNYVKKQGIGSYKFNVASGLSTSYLHLTGMWDISSQLNLSSAYRLYVDFPALSTSAFSSVSIVLQSSVGNYYTITTTDQYDGTAWLSGNWSLLSFPLSSIVTTGTPVATNITDIYINFNHSGSFIPTANMRVDYLYLVTPDLMDAIYASSYKGTDTTGVTSKVLMTEDSDILSFGDYAQDLIYPIALKASQILSPQLLADPNFATLYKQDFEETIRLYGKVFPRHRASGNFGATELLR